MPSQAAPGSRLNLKLSQDALEHLAERFYAPFGGLRLEAAFGAAFLAGVLVEVFVRCAELALRSSAPTSTGTMLAVASQCRAGSKPQAPRALAEGATRSSRLELRRPRTAL